jgi:ribosome biogenesis GTPase A
MLPQNASVFKKHITDFSLQKWQKDLAKKVNGILDNELNRLNKEDLMHRQQLDHMLNDWKQMFHQETYKTKYY